ncbi:MAG: TonB C-terminal domain-containing protein [Nitrospirae bacterium]|nr:MAG: TonB C-terminal domain-containing protein [Nitrospirota bacterium]
MKGPSLRITAILSLVIHITFFFTALVLMNRSNHFIRPPAYIVSLVGTEVADTGSPEEGGAAVSEDEPAPRMSLPSDTSKKLKPSDDTKQYAENRIAAMEATKKAKNILRLRNVISIKGSGGSEEGEITGPEENGEEDMLASYENKIGREIWRHYTVIPEIKGKNLEAIISVTVMRDGTLRINKVEKSSGNIIFDRSVLKAVAKASPVSPPPYEMEIGLRFTP